jgi:hypothetical protein
MASYAPQYSAVIFPDRTRVLGVRLLPLSVGQALLLWRIGSPFVAGGPFATGDIVSAIYVLSCPCNAAARGLQRRRTRWLLKLWAWQLRRRKADVLIAACTALSGHVARAFEGPTMWEDGEGGAKCSAPYLQTLKTRLMECFGMGRDAALDYAIQEAIWDIAASAEDHGRAEWVSAEEADTIESLATIVNN